MSIINQKNKSAYVLLVFLFLPIANPAYAQESSGSVKQAVGFSGGSAIGPGLTYRRYFSRSFIQGAFFTRVRSRGDVTDFLLGASYGRVLSEITIVKAMPPTALVLVAGINGVYSKDTYVSRVNSEENTDEKSLHTGVGIALEIGNTFSPGLLFSLGTTYTLSMDRQAGSWEWSLGPQVIAGLLYNW